MSWDPDVPITEYTSFAASCLYCACTLVADATEAVAEKVRRDHIDVHAAHYELTGDTRLPEHMRPIDVIRARDHRVEVTYVATSGVSFDVHVRRIADDAVSTSRVRLEGGDKRMITDALVEALRAALGAS